MFRRFFIHATTLLFLVFITKPALADGKPLDLSAYKGKVVMVDFWASWCGPCRQSFPWLNQMKAEKEADGLVILGVNVDEKTVDAEKFLANVPADFKVIYDPTGDYPSYYEILGMPSSLIFGRDGTLIHQHVGFKTEQISAYEKVIDDALKAN